MSGLGCAQAGMIMCVSVLGGTFVAPDWTWASQLPAKGQYVGYLMRHLDTGTLFGVRCAIGVPGPPNIDTLCWGHLEGKSLVLGVSLGTLSGIVIRSYFPVGYLLGPATMPSMVTCGCTCHSGLRVPCPVPCSPGLTHLPSRPNFHPGS